LEVRETLQQISLRGFCWCPYELVHV